MQPLPISSPSGTPEFDDRAPARSGTHRRRAGIIGTIVIALAGFPLIADAAPEPDAAPAEPSVPTTIDPGPIEAPEPGATPLPTLAPASEPATTDAPAGDDVDSDPTGDVDATTEETTTPAVTTTTTPVAPRADPVPDALRPILASIRHLESRNDYTIPPNSGNASGAYQFIESTWGGYRGYQHAYLAPPAIQDERAASDVQKFLDQFDGDISMVPVMWYYPKAAREPIWMDRVPKPEFGNKLTVREYQTRWLSIYASFSGERVTPRPLGIGLNGDSADPIPTPAPPPPPSITDGLAPESLAFPVLGPSRVALPTCDSMPVTSGVVEPESTDTDTEINADTDVSTTTTTVAPDVTTASRDDLVAAGLCGVVDSVLVFGVQLQPVLSMSDGVVTDVRDQPAPGEPIQVTITNEFGVSFVYSGFNDDNPGTDDGAAPRQLRITTLARLGTTVRAGQIIGFMGDSDPLPATIRSNVPTLSITAPRDDATAPHIRVRIIGMNGQPINAFRTLSDALYEHSCKVMIAPWSMPFPADPIEPFVVETTDDDDEIDSEWEFTASGQVRAAGWAAMVNPNEACGWSPNEKFGADGAGSNEPLEHWSDPYELPTPVWVALSMRDELNVPALFRR